MKMKLERADIPYRCGRGVQTHWLCWIEDDLMIIEKLSGSLAKEWGNYRVDRTELIGGKFNTLEAALKAIEDLYD